MGFVIGVIVVAGVFLWLRRHPSNAWRGRPVGSEPVDMTVPVVPPAGLMTGFYDSAGPTDSGGSGDSGG